MCRVALCTQLERAARRTPPLVRQSASLTFSEYVVVGVLPVCTAQLTYIGRPSMAQPAVGMSKRNKTQGDHIIACAFPK